MAWLRIAYTAFLGLAIQQLFPLLFLPGVVNPALAGKLAPQPGGFVLNCLNGFLSIWSLGLLVFGSHLLVLGWLVLQARFVPKAVGLLTLLGAGCYVITNAANLLLTDYAPYKATLEQVLSGPMALGELGLAGWLLAKGGRHHGATRPS